MRDTPAVTGALIAQQGPSSGARVLGRKRVFSSGRLLGLNQRPPPCKGSLVISQPFVVVQISPQTDILLLLSCCCLPLFVWVGVLMVNEVKLRQHLYQKLEDSPKVALRPGPVPEGWDVGQSRFSTCALRNEAQIEVVGKGVHVIDDVTCQHGVRTKLRLFKVKVELTDLASRRNALPDRTVRLDSCLSRYVAAECRSATPRTDCPYGFRLPGSARTYETLADHRIRHSGDVARRSDRILGEP